MKLKIRNPFADITEVNLTDKELKYTMAIVSGDDRQETIKTMHMTPVELAKLYEKFGLTDKTKIREVQLATIIGMSGLLNNV